MATIFQTTFPNALKYVPKGPMEYNPALNQRMAWRSSGKKPLSEPMMALFIDAYMHHSASMIFLVIHPWSYCNESVCMFPMMMSESWEQL